MLSNPDLKREYETKLTWLFVSRNFKGDATDREAERTHDRFGVTCWPILVVFDPRTDEVLAELPRTLAACRPILDRILARKFTLPAGTATRPSVDARVLELEEIVLRKQTLEPAAQPQLAALLADPQADIVLRIRALRALQTCAPQLVVAHAKELLQIPNDPLRYAVLDLVAAHPDPALAPVLGRIFADAGGKVPSINPNVLRIHAAKCLGTSGDAATIGILAPIARTANPRNGLSPVLLKALATLATRLPDARGRVVEVLLGSFPAAVPQGADVAQSRPALALAKAAREALETASGRKDLPPLPAQWHEQPRDAFLVQLRTAVLPR